MSDYIPHNIRTESGKELWRMFNQHYGSSVWGPIGDGIEKIEFEVEERIFSIISYEIALMTKKGATFGKRKEYDEGYLTALQDIFILIGDNR